VHRPLIALSLAASLLACAAPLRDEHTSAPVLALPDLTSYALMRTDGGTPVAVTIDEAADALEDYDVVFFGELHDHAGNHLAEMDLFRALHARAPQLALSMEQFERDVQPVVDDYLASRIGEDALRGRGRAWGNYAEAYRPLVEYAKEHKVPVIAAEVPTSIVRCVGQEGPAYLSRLGVDRRGWAAAELHVEDGPYKDKFLRFLAESGSHGPDATTDKAAAEAEANRGFAAQTTRDDTMAESIFLYLQKNPGHKVVHVTGAFHVEGFLGTVERLKLRGPNLKLAVIVPVETDDAVNPALAPDAAKRGNFAFLIRSLPKEYASDAEQKAAEDRIRGMIRTRSACAS
jgi:uncharacterized iron-regulated protein